MRGLALGGSTFACVGFAFLAVGLVESLIRSFLGAELSGGFASSEDVLVVGGAGTGGGFWVVVAFAEVGSLGLLGFRGFGALAVPFPSAIDLSFFTDLIMSLAILAIHLPSFRSP